MTSAKLILIEGIPGSGKTTTARYVSHWLEKYGLSPALFLEGDLDHPADYESVACLDEDEWCRLQNRFPGQVSLLSRNVWVENSSRFIRYRKLAQENGDDVPKDLYDALAELDVYSLPAEKYQRILKQSWQNFVLQAEKEQRTYVFECCFLQNPVTTLLAFHNLSETAVRVYIAELCEIILPLKPILVYLAQTDVRNTLQQVRSARPVEWSEFVISYLTGEKYGQANGLQGFEGVIEFYRKCQVFEADLLSFLPISSVTICDRDEWNVRYSTLTDFLGNCFS